MIWKDIDNYKGYYQVSNTGLVRSLDRYITGKDKIKKFFRGKILKPSFDGKGNYLFVNLNKNGKYKSIDIHRLVALHFIKKPDNNNYYEVNHKNLIKTDNHVDNLEWVTKSENQLHRYS